MLMPGRQGYALQGGWAQGGSSVSRVPATLTLDSRSNNTPAKYRASEGIEFLPGFESGTGDSFETIITQEAGSIGSGGSGVYAGGGYRYGFNSKENDNEVKGEGAQQDYGMRIYDPRLGKFLSVDPLADKFPFYTPYQFAGNMPIRYIDLDGAEPAEPGKKKGEIKTGTNGNSDVAHSWKWDGKKWNENNLDAVVIKTKAKYTPELDFLNSPLTKYNSKNESGYTVTNTATVNSLLLEFAQNWECKSCHNKVIVGGELLNDDKNLSSVQKLFRQGVSNLYNKEKGFTPGATFMESYRMSDLNGPDGDRMKEKVLRDLLNGKPITDSRLFSAEFFLGSYGFSMRVTNDGKNMAITVYDSKTIQSATDGGKTMLKKMSPLDENTAPTYQRYFWSMPIGEVINAYKESVISEYKSND